jgi:hypothetical protein
LTFESWPGTCPMSQKGDHLVRATDSEQQKKQSVELSQSFNPAAHFK